MSNDRFKGVKGIAYYRVNLRTGRAYWCPTKQMREVGFGVASLGPDGPDAREGAANWNARWQVARKDAVARLGLKALSQSNGCYVYFIRAGDRIKIGITRTPTGRLASIAANIPDKISQIVVVPGTRADEKKLHDRFLAYRSRGEWFRACRPLQLTIMRCAAACAVIHDGEDASRTRVESLDDFLHQNTDAESNRGTPKRRAKCLI